MADIKSIQAAVDGGSFGYLVRDNRAAGHGDHYKDRPFDLLKITGAECDDGGEFVRIDTMRVCNAVFDDRGVPSLPSGMGPSLKLRRSLERETVGEKRYDFLPASELRELAPEPAPEPMVLEPTPAEDPQPVTIDRLYALMATLLDEQRTTNTLLRAMMRGGQQGQQLTLIPVASTGQPSLPLAANGATGARQ